MQEAIVPKAMILDVVALLFSHLREKGFSDDDFKQAMRGSTSGLSQGHTISLTSAPIDEAKLTPYGRIELRRQRVYRIFVEHPGRWYGPMDVGAELVQWPEKLETVMSDVYNDLKNLLTRDLIERFEQSPKRVFYRLKQA